MLCMLLGLVLQEMACENPSGTHCCHSPCVWSSLDPAPLYPSYHLPIASVSEASSLQPQDSVLGCLRRTRPPELDLLLVLIGQQSINCRSGNGALFPPLVFPPCLFLSILPVSLHFSVFTLRTFPVTVNFAGYLPSIFGPQTTLQLLKSFSNLPPKRAFLASFLKDRNNFILYLVPRLIEVPLMRPREPEGHMPRTGAMACGIDQSGTRKE